LDNSVSACDGDHVGGNYNGDGGGVNNKEMDTEATEVGGGAVNEVTTAAVATEDDVDSDDEMDDEGEELLVEGGVVGSASLVSCVVRLSVCCLPVLFWAVVIGDDQ
jgi:hypothetical protein